MKTGVTTPSIKGLEIAIIIIIIISQDLSCVNRFTPMRTHGESKQKNKEKVKVMRCSIVARQNTMYSRLANYTTSPG